MGVQELPANVAGLFGRTTMPDGPRPGPLRLRIASPLTGELCRVGATWPAVVEECHECEREIEVETHVVEMPLADGARMRREGVAVEGGALYHVRNCPWCGPVWSAS